MNLNMGVLGWLLLILSLYPIVGALFWFWGALMYQFFGKKEELDFVELAQADQPMITIMIPAHNEEIMIRRTIEYLETEINYQNYELLIMDDGSTDDTEKILSELQGIYPNLRTIKVEDNKGKAHAFNIGMFFAKGEYILSNDADTLPEPHALMKYMNYFVHDEDINTAAVTANMDVFNRSTMLGKSQTVEFSSIVGIIKRSQSAINNSMYAYSGANTMYRKSALLNVGGFRQNRATEDISIAWDHQINGMVPKFAPDIKFHMVVPETIGELFRQRSRWAKGGTEVWMTNMLSFILHPIKNRYQVTMFVDSTLSVIWSFFYVISTVLYLAMMGYLLATGQNEQFISNLGFSFVMITSEIIAGSLQLLTALIMDFKGEKLKYWFFAPLYMMFYWIVNPLTIVVTFIPAVKTIMGLGSGTWRSPSRG
ncbi:glycosyltransferase [Lentilactobacillus sp. Marseille-Q4993]|uniref:glycosyltransferase family 2 protein n=1 Tax=Lentilactobacillus sp. Marseille-Q4993 TaxID=3039492 RepID=UPI0024BD3074|nr:glycosyltransferase [Lentilactobacillus sp. Marseille-Q4993]